MVRRPPPKNRNYSFYERYERSTANPLFPHVVLLLIRKNWYKLDEFIRRSPDTDKARKYIVELKYYLSKCRPELRVLLQNIVMNTEKTTIDTSSMMRFTLKYDYSTTIIMRIVRDNVPQEMRYNVFFKLDDASPEWFGSTSMNGYDIEANQYENYIIASVKILTQIGFIFIHDVSTDHDRREGIADAFNRFKPVSTDEDYYFNEKSKMK